MSIFVTGDIHGQPFPRLQRSIISENELNKDDYVIICGDFGLVWERHESRTEEYYRQQLGYK